VHSRTIYNLNQNCWSIKKYKIFTSGEGRIRAAIVITNNRLDTLLIKQLSDEDTIVLEVIIDNKIIILATMYSDISQRIEIDG